MPGLHRMKAEQLDRLRPDTVIVFDAHWFTTVEFVVTAHERRSGRYTSDELPRGMCQVPYDFPGDPELAKLIGEEVTEAGSWMTPIDDPVPADPLSDGQPVAVPAGRGAVGQREHGADRRDRRLPARRRGDRACDRAQRAAGRAAGERGDEPHVLEAARAACARGVGPVAHPHARGAGRRSRAARLVPGWRPRPGHRHDARVPPRQAGGDVRALPDDDRRDRRPRVRGARRALQRLRELRRHRPGPRLVLQTGARLDRIRVCAAEYVVPARPAPRTPAARTYSTAQEVVLSAIWRVFRSLWKSRA